MAEGIPVPITGQLTTKEAADKEAAEVAGAFGLDRPQPPEAGMRLARPGRGEHWQGPVGLSPEFRSL
jgi:hypothetical protein